ncbi:MAG: hypothetical protein AUI14_05485 [Actinobacteria bacterium 13_2_20CM_2_71_6]|nr:MAG: hypothetical protein AUI14_05485 [Actinobacteria bacterium 13_2_20CM_2_71_6]
MSGERLSAPPARTLPRRLSAAEVAAYTSVADVLCGGLRPAPSELPSFPELLHQALRLRGESFDAVVRLLAEAPPEALEAWLRRLHDERPGEFEPLSSVAAGAYLMEPRIRAVIGYPVQERDRPGVEEAADDLAGLLEI